MVGDCTKIEQLERIADLISSGYALDVSSKEIAAQCIAAMLSPWRPIEGAPRDGTRILVADTNVGMAIARNWPCDGYWIEDAASGMRLNQPTHWMPLPEPPR